ncbi:MAG: pentapeptide repeat-containing protein [Xenococcaceae cyanobacterium MO_234.B1]|nr:pentapeptide repeat-containing protein [Xenococcaceae cyanobacterium MO_234.B1]
MANEEQLRILKEEGVEVWNEWQQKNLDIEIDLTGANLTGANLTGVNLTGANLTGANLEGANLTEAYLYGSSLEEVNFRKANLYKANLTGANLTGAYLYKAYLERAYLTEANLTGVYLEKAHLERAYLTEANLTEVILYRANLERANLERANLERANLERANLERANLERAYLTEVILKEANLTGANLTEVILKEVNLEKAILIATQALHTKFRNTNLTGACIQDWNINNQTNLNDISCDYIYLKGEWNHKIKKYAFSERRPCDPNKNFEPEEFTKLFQKALETVDLIFLDGIDWQAFLTSFQKLQVESNNHELAIQAIERKTDGAFVVRVEVPPDANKADIEQYLKKEYEIELKAIEDKYRLELNAKDREIEIYKQQNTNIFEIAKLAASRPINVEAKAVTENQSKNVEVEMNFQAKVTGAAGKVEGNQIIYASEQKQTLAEAAAEIQQLLKQLEQTNPTATEAQKIAYINDETTPSFKRRVAGALKAAGEAAIDELLDNAYLKVGKAAIMGWIEAGN